MMRLLAWQRCGSGFQPDGSGGILPSVLRLHDTGRMAQTTASTRTPKLRAKGQPHASPGHRPGATGWKAASPEGAGQNGPHYFVPPLQGLDRPTDLTQGVALGWHGPPLWGCQFRNSGSRHTHDR